MAPKPSIPTPSMSATPTITAAAASKVPAWSVMADEENDRAVVADDALKKVLAKDPALAKALFVGGKNNKSGQHFARVYAGSSATDSILAYICDSSQKGATKNMRKILEVAVHLKLNGGTGYTQNALSSSTYLTLLSEVYKRDGKARVTWTATSDASQTMIIKFFKDKKEITVTASGNYQTMIDEALTKLKSA